MRVDFLSSEFSDVAVWAGKPLKENKRFFAYSNMGGALWFVKIDDTDDGSLTRELEALRLVHAIARGTPLASSIPVPGQSGGGVLLQSFVDGISLTRLAVQARRRWRRRALKRAATQAIDWLVDFHRLGARPGADGQSATERMGMLHGDFKPSNVLVSAQGNISVVDWEFLVGDGLQVFDAFQFVTYLGLTCAGRADTMGFSQTFVERNWISAIVRSLLCRYVQALGCPAEPLATAYAGYLDFLTERCAALGVRDSGLGRRFAPFVAAQAQIPFALSVGSARDDRAAADSPRS
jgi:Phosphotransferase enzyme family